MATLIQLFANPSSSPGGVEAVMRQIDSVAAALGYKREEYHDCSFALRKLSSRYPMLNMPANVFQLNWKLRERVRKADVVVSHGMYGAWVTHPRHIYVLHSTFGGMAEAIQPHVPQLDYLICRYLWGGHLEKQNTRRARCVAVSSAVQHEASRLYGAASEVIYNSIAEVFVPQAPPARASLSLPLTTRIVLAVGRRETLKGKRLLSKVAASLPSDTALVSVGTGAAIPGVHCLPPVDQQHISAYYASADWVLNPSLYEGFGLTVLEALACGKPVISTPVGIVPELMGHSPAFDACVAVANDCSNSLAEAVARALSNPGMGAEQVRWARESVLPRFSTLVFQERWSKLLGAQAN